MEPKCLAEEEQEGGGGGAGDRLCVCCRCAGAEDGSVGLQASCPPGDEDADPRSSVGMCGRGRDGARCSSVEEGSEGVGSTGACS